LPPYSPDLSPIEPAWAKVEAGLRRIAARTAEETVQNLGGLTPLAGRETLADADLVRLNGAIIRHVGGGASMSCRSPPPGLGYGETIRDMGHREHASAGRPPTET
jgi:hypothetical protein